MTYLLIIFPLNAVPLSAKISTMYIPFDKEEMSDRCRAGVICL